MACEQRLNWLMLTLICPLIAGAPSSMSKRHVSCPEENLNITGGSFVLSNGYSDGSLLRYTCPNGYYPSVQSRHCQYGLWTPKTSTRRPAECKKVTCPNPRVMENGQVTPHQQRYYVNDTTTYSCYSDYKFCGSAVRVCKPNGKWSGSTPICGRDSDHCPDPGVPPGSSRTGHMFNIDDKVRYRCDSTLTLIGSKERVCQEGGQWSGTEPQCYAHFTYDTPEEASEAFSSALKSNLAVSQQYREDQQGKKITLDQGGKLDIYIAVDVSGSINDNESAKAKNTIKLLIEKISDYQVSPNYEIMMFATDVETIVSMRDFKTNKAAKSLSHILKSLADFKLDKRIGKGTNVAKVYSTIYESMIIEKQNDPKGFLETQHIIIVFTDGKANMGGKPAPKVKMIKELVTKNDLKREAKLDLFVFGIGDVYIQYINGMVSQRDQEKHFFKLSDLYEVQKMLDSMIDESTSVGLCGIYQNYDTDNKRRALPWLAQINIARSSHSSNCMGSLVTSSYILTAAHCFREEDTPEKITVHLEKHLAVKVKRFILHPDYDIRAKQSMGIREYFEFDAALIQLDKPVRMSVNLRPICIPCTKETNGALRLSDREGTCRKHEELLMSNELVEASFTSKMDSRSHAPGKIKNIKIKRGKYRDACVQDANKGINEGLNAKDIVTDNFLCSGGTEPTIDDVACKGETGGATFVNNKRRTIQVGIVSWGVKDLCLRNKDPLSEEDSRDYHTNLFSEKIQSFLEEHLGNDQIGDPLSFL